MTKVIVKSPFVRPMHVRVSRCPFRNGMLVGWCLFVSCLLPCHTCVVPLPSTPSRAISVAFVPVSRHPGPSTSSYLVVAVGSEVTVWDMDKESKIAGPMHLMHEGTRASRGMEKEEEVILGMEPARDAPVVRVTSLECTAQPPPRVGPLGLALTTCRPLHRLLLIPSLRSLALVVGDWTEWDARRPVTRVAAARALREATVSRDGTHLVVLREGRREVILTTVQSHERSSGPPGPLVKQYAMTHVVPEFLTVLHERQDMGGLSVTHVDLPWDDATSLVRLVRVNSPPLDPLDQLHPQHHDEFSPSPVMPPSSTYLSHPVFHPTLPWLLMTVSGIPVALDQSTMKPIVVVTGVEASRGLAVSMDGALVAALGRGVVTLLEGDLSGHDARGWLLNGWGFVGGEMTTPTVWFDPQLPNVTALWTLSETGELARWVPPQGSSPHVIDCRRLRTEENVAEGLRAAALEAYMHINGTDSSKVADVRQQLVERAQRCASQGIVHVVPRRVVGANQFGTEIVAQVDAGMHCREPKVRDTTHDDTGDWVQAAQESSEDHCQDLSTFLRLFFDPTNNTLLPQHLGREGAGAIVQTWAVDSAGSAMAVVETAMEGATIATLRVSRSTWRGERRECVFTGTWEHNSQRWDWNQMMGMTGMTAALLLVCGIGVVVRVLHRRRRCVSAEADYKRAV